MTKKKEKYVPKVGITGEGEDYSIYKLSMAERITGFLIGFAAGFAAAHIMFGVIFVSAIIGIAVGFLAVPIFRKYLLNRRTRMMLLQFRDMLDSLSNSFSSGRNTSDAFSDAYQDLLLSAGAEAPITKELSIITKGLHNNYVIEDLLKDMSFRCGIDDIESFAETFTTCNRLGGNLKKIVSDTRDIISDKIEIEMDIQTTITASKNEINVMTVMPFLVIMMMGTMGEESITENSALNVIVKLIAVAMFALAYKIGQKITDIKM